MIPPHSCAVPGRKPGHVDERDERDVERVARADEARGLRRRVDVEHAGERVRLVADDADAAAAEPREAADDVLGEARLQLEERRRRRRRAAITRFMSYGFVGSSGTSVVELGRLAVDRIGRLVVRRRLAGSTAAGS